MMLTETADAVANELQASGIAYTVPFDPITRQQLQRSIRDRMFGKQVRVERCHDVNGDCIAMRWTCR